MTRISEPSILANGPQQVNSLIPTTANVFAFHKRSVSVVRSAALTVSGFYNIIRTKSRVPWQIFNHSKL